MPLYKYRAKNPEGQTLEGLVEAPTEKAAVETLLTRELILISIEEKKKRFFLAELKIFNRIKAKDIVIFARQLSVMISAMVPVVQALRILVKQTSNPNLKKIIDSVADDVDGGTKFSVALAKYPKAFDDFFVSMIKTGETTGRLDQVLNYLADQKEKDYELRSKIKGMVIYPVFIFFALIVVGIVAMVFVVPKLIEVIVESGAELPLATRLLIGTSNLLVGWWWLLLIIIVGLIIAWRFYVKTPQGRYSWDSLKLKMPILGKLFQRIYLVRFSRSLATLSEGGVPLPYAMEVISDVVGNEVYRNLILRTKKEVEDGNPLAKVFLESKVVPPMLSQTMSIGEQAGKLSEVLKKVSDFYAREVERILTDLVTLIEPIVIIILGLGVGVMVAAVIMPMYNLASSI